MEKRHTPTNMYPESASPVGFPVLDSITRQWRLLAGRNQGGVSSSLHSFPEFILCFFQDTWGSQEINGAEAESFGRCDHSFKPDAHSVAGIASPAVPGNSDGPAGYADDSVGSKPAGLGTVGYTLPSPSGGNDLG